MIRRLGKIILGMMTMISSLFAVNVTIDVGDYSGQYHTYKGYSTTSSTIDFSINQRHRVGFADQPNGFYFNVLADGTITSDSTRVMIEGNTIRFLTQAVQIDSGLYKMQYKINGKYYRATTTEIFFVPAGTGSDDFGDQNTFALGDQSNGAYIHMNKDGVIYADSSRFSIVNGNTIRVNTVPITIDPERCNINYVVIGGVWLRGKQDLHLIPTGTGSDDYGTKNVINIGDQWNRIHFEITPEGNVVSDSTRIVIDGNVVQFKTVPVIVDPQSYDRNYQIGTGYVKGETTVYMPPAGTGSMDSGSRYKMVLGDQSNGFRFDMDVDGNILSDSSRFTIENGNKIIFSKTFSITFTPQDESIIYNVVGGKYSYGTDTVSLVPSGTGASDFGDKIKFSVGTISKIISIDDPCAVIPSEQITVGEGESATNFSVTCPNTIIDTDQDGIADTSDNCVEEYNPAQLDQDADGIGNVCDSDLDNDTVNNDIDNCLYMPNLDQSDIDADGIGDTCDDDDDDDSVPTLEDNCPWIPNVGQLDNDQDGMGDACDEDDDNDLIIDTNDNCQVIYNPEQLDIDADTIGDVCDADTDGDGVINENDTCSNTPIGAQVTSDGCNGYQYVDSQCIKDEFPNHGRYVKCVSHTSNEMVDMGLLTKQERSRIVSEAAKFK